MSEPDLIVYVCRNCLPSRSSSSALESYAREAAGDASVSLREIPCSGKIDIPYLLKAFEGGARGVAVITCPLGACRLAEGNRRAQVRIRHVARLLDEIGLGGQRLALFHCASGEEGRDVPALVERAVDRLSSLPESPLRGLSEGVRTEQT